MRLWAIPLGILIAYGCKTASESHTKAPPKRAYFDLGIDRFTTDTQSSRQKYASSVWRVAGEAVELDDRYLYQLRRNGTTDYSWYMIVYKRKNLADHEQDVLRWSKKNGMDVSKSMVGTYEGQRVRLVKADTADAYGQTRIPIDSDARAAKWDAFIDRYGQLSKRLYDTEGAFLIGQLGSDFAQWDHAIQDYVLNEALFVKNPEHLKSYYQSIRNSYPNSTRTFNAYETAKSIIAKASAGETLDAKIFSQLIRDATTSSTAVISPVDAIYDADGNNINEGMFQTICSRAT